MILIVTTEKFSATVDEDVLAEARARTGPRGLSAFVNEAMRNELKRAALRDLLDDLAAEIGPPDEEAVAEADLAIGRLTADAS